MTKDAEQVGEHKLVERVVARKPKLYQSFYFQYWKHIKDNRLTSILILTDFVAFKTISAGTTLNVLLLVVDFVKIIKPRNRFKPFLVLGHAVRYSLTCGMAT
eukprot:2829219-Amphidinium_carterae.1